MLLLGIQMIDKSTNMARPIENTPIITGEDAKRFRKDLLDTVSKKMSSKDEKKRIQDRREMEENYKLMVSISNGSFY